MGLLQSWIFGLTLASLGPDASQPGPPSAPEIVPPVVSRATAAERPNATPTERVEVLLLLDIDEAGKVVVSEVLRSGGARFDEAAAAALAASSFTPATEDGVPIAVQIEYLYVFDPIAPEVIVPQVEPTPAPLEIDDFDTVTARPVETEAAQTELRADDGERIAGVQGDAIKAAQTLPGVARTPAGGGDLVVWGAAASDTRLYVDWVPVPTLFHLGGGRSVLPSQAVKSITLVPAGAGPAYGRALGGFLRATTLSPRALDAPRGTGMFARADLVDFGAGADSRLGQRGWAFVALRRSVLAQTYGSVVGEDARLLVPIPESWDYQSKAHVQVTSRTSVELLAIGSNDSVVRGIPSRTPDATFTERQGSAFHRVGIRLARTRTDGSSWEAAAWGGLDDASTIQSFAGVNAFSSQRAWRGGLRLDEHRRVAKFLVLRSGVDFELRADDNEREGAITLPGREGDIRVFGQAPGDRVGQDRWRNVNVGIGVYTALRFELAEKRWRIEPGLRVEPMVASGDRIRPIRPIDPAVGYSELDVTVDPRLRIEWQPIEALTTFAAGGRYHQAAASSDRSPTFGAPKLEPSQAYQAVAGINGAPTRWMDLGVQGFFIRSQSLAARADDPTPPIAELLVAEGEGRNFGGQASAQVRPHATVQIGLAYALMRAQRRGPGDASWRLFDFDQTHVLQGLVGWSHRSGVELGARTALSSGNPRTEVVSAVSNARTGGFDPVFGSHNEDRLPLFFELSLRLGWGRSWSWGSLRTWLDLQNATNRSNAQEFFYNADYTARGTVSGLPILPLVGLEVRL